MRIRNVGVDEEGLTRSSGLLQQLVHVLTHQFGILSAAAELHIPRELRIRFHVRMLVNHGSKPASLLQQSRQSHRAGIDGIESQPTAAMRYQSRHQRLAARLTNRYRHVMISKAMRICRKGIQYRSRVERITHPARRIGIHIVSGDQQQVASEILGGKLSATDRQHTTHQQPDPHGSQQTTNRHPSDNHHPSPSTQIRQNSRRVPRTQLLLC